MRRSVITHRRSWEWGSSASHWTLSYTRARVGSFLNIVFTEHAFSSIHKTKIVCPFANSAIWKLLHNYFQLEKYTRKRKETQTSAALLHQSPYKNTVIFSSFFFFAFHWFPGPQFSVCFVCVQHWEDDVRRFHRMFRHSTDTELVVLVGNHDIGFHYE